MALALSDASVVEHPNRGRGQDGRRTLGHEKFLWVTTYDWGDLAFGIRAERCLTGPRRQAGSISRERLAGKPRGT